MTQTRLLPMLLIAATFIIAPSAWAVDLDEDGIDDSLEQTLIDMYRPMLHYDTDENVRPASVEWYIRHSELIWRQTIVIGGQPEVFDTIVYHNSQLDDPNDPNSPLLILSAGGGALPPSTTTEAPGDVGYRINVFDDFHGGPPPPEQPVGMYAHVVSLMGPLSYINGPTLPPQPLNYSDYYLVQYWQFFPYNDFQFEFGLGNHEGDWVWVDLLVERTCPYELRYMVYHHHGDNECAPVVLGDGFGPLPGFIGNAPVPCDPGNTAKIPQCYLEAGAHEWWPNPTNGGECDFCVPCLLFLPCCGIDCCIHNRSHAGFGTSLRSQNVTNLGERYAPMSGIEPQIIMLYNGIWGHDHGIPNGPSAGVVHSLAPGYPLAPLFVAHVDAAAPTWSSQGLGSRYHPIPELADALAEPDGVQTGGRVLIAPHNYPGPHTFSRPMRLERDASAGSVILGN